MKGVIKGMGSKQTYWIDGREVSKGQFKKAFPDRSLEGNGDCITAWKRPILSDALAVHRSQIAEVSELYRQQGVNVDHLEDGRPVIRDRGQRREMMRIRGVHDNNGGYGDDHN